MKIRTKLIRQAVVDLAKIVEAGGPDEKTFEAMADRLEELAKDVECGEQWEVIAE